MTSPPPYEGRHLLADLHGCSGLADEMLVRTALASSAAAAGATLLDIRTHGFGPGQGVTGVALLAESHISIHTWPEHGYAAVDLFMCGATNDIDAALRTIATALAAGTIEARTVARGYAAELAGWDETVRAAE